jgi:hypothetical protein
MNLEPNFRLFSMCKINSNQYQMKTSLISFAIIFLINSGLGSPFFQQTQNGDQKLNAVEQAFFDHLRSLCGKSFSGEETFMADGHDSWAHLDFVMHVTVCEDDRVYIPFHLSDDHSRTWMFLIEDGRLRFRHDHRGEDGTPDKLNLYGGYANGSGTAFEQHFPNDDFTMAMLDDERERIWSVVLDEELQCMIYRLSYGDRLIFEATFDLSGEIDER